MMMLKKVILVLERAQVHLELGISDYGSHAGKQVALDRI
jgi:hypothetical protein